MELIYALKRKDGRVSITRITPTLKPIEMEDGRREMVPYIASINEVISKFSPEDQADIVSYRQITEDELPQSREFRDAWTDDFDTDTIDINVEKAKELWKDEWRKTRLELFQELDLDFRRAIEAWFLANTTPEQAPEIHKVAEKAQKLRDVTDVNMQDIETPEALLNIWPSVLGPKPGRF